MSPPISRDSPSEWVQPEKGGWMRWSGGGYNEVKSIQLSATKSMDHRRQWSKGIVAVFGFAAFQDDGAAWNGMGGKVFFTVNKKVVGSPTSALQ